MANRPMRPNIEAPHQRYSVPLWHELCISASQAPQGFRRGMRQMTYIRSRPWRPRGPWFCNRAGARRRGRRNDELTFESAGEMTFQDGVLAEPQDIVEDDVLLPVVESRPIPEPMLATSANADYVLDVASGPPASNRLPRQLDGIADEVIAAHTLSRQREDDTGARRSA